MPTKTDMTTPLDASKPEPVSDQPTAERKSFTCHDCGFVWLQGEHGGHDCKTRILTRLERVRDQRDAARAELERVKQALGIAERAMTHAGDDLAQLRADLAAAREENAKGRAWNRLLELELANLRSIRDDETL